MMTKKKVHSLTHSFLFLVSTQTFIPFTYPCITFLFPPCTIFTPLPPLTHPPSKNLPNHFLQVSSVIVIVPGLPPLAPLLSLLSQVVDRIHLIWSPRASRRLYVYTREVWGESLAGKWAQYWERAIWYCDVVGRCEVGHVAERGRIGWWEFIVVVVRFVGRAKAVVVMLERRAVRLRRSGMYIVLGVLKVIFLYVYVCVS